MAVTVHPERVSRGLDDARMDEVGVDTTAVGEALEASDLQQIRAWLMAYCGRFGGSQADCEDIVQETLLRTLPLLTRVRQHPNWRGYLCLTAKRIWIDNARRTHAAEANLQRRDVSAQTPPFATDLTDAMNALSHHLSDTQVRVFLLCEAFEYRAAEVAQLLQTSESAVKSVLHRARQQLHQVRSEIQHGNTPTPAEPVGRTDLQGLYVEAVALGDPTLLLRILQRSMQHKGHRTGMGRAKALANRRRILVLPAIRAA